MAHYDEVLTYEILMNGIALVDSIEIETIKIDQGINRISKAEVTIVDGSLFEAFEISSSDNFVPGNTIEIKLGYTNSNQTVFKGNLTGQRIKMKNDGSSFFIIDCIDLAGRMAFSPRNKIYEDRTDSEVMIEILQQYGFSAEVTKTQIKYSKTIQNDTTDWNFLVTKAAANGMVVNTINSKVTIDIPSFNKAPVAILQKGYNVYKFDLTMDATTQFDTVVASSWSDEQNKLLTATASEPKLPSQGTLSGKKLSSSFNDGPLELFSSKVMSKQELKMWADIELIKGRLAKIQGNIETVGNHLLTPNVLVKLKGIGNRFNGDAYVTSVFHEVKYGEWRTVIGVGELP